MRGKRDIFSTYEHGKVEYPNRSDGDYDYDKIWIGVRGKLIRKFKGMVKLGFANYKYDSGRKDDTVEWRSELEYNPRKNVILTLAGGRGTQPTTYKTEDSSKSTNIGLRCKYLPPKLEKVTLGAGFEHTNYDFDSGREDDVWKYFVKGDYKMNKWLKIGLQYNRNKRDSNVPSREYKQNRLSLILTGEF